MRPMWFCCVLAVVATFVPADAFAAERSGTVVAVVPASQAVAAGEVRTLVVSAPVFTGDIIKTSAGGETQILLDDDTKLVVGPNSYMTVDEFVFDGSRRAKKVTLNAVRGAFRFITGSSRKEAYEIKTPTATIGVRGTEFDFTIDRRGELNLALFDGEASICRPRTGCVTVSGVCNVVAADRRQPVRQLETLERLEALRTKFPYVASQATLRRDFQVNTSDCSVRRASLPPPLSTGSIARANVTVPGGGGGSPPPVTPIPPDEPPVTQPPTTSGGSNHSGLGDGSNPGNGSSNNNAQGGGTDNPGGSSNGGGGGNGNGGNN